MTMSDDAVRIFAEHAPDYHAMRRRLVPGLDALEQRPS
jgi:hypothetical protein